MKTNLKSTYLPFRLLIGGLIIVAFPWSLPVTASPNEASHLSEQEQQVSSRGNQARRSPEQDSQIHLILSLSDREVSVQEDEEVIATYPVAVGKPGWETPTGEFEVRNMVRNPSWQNPWTGEVIPAGKNNPLGRRWISFWSDGKNSIGFHGTPDESVMGEAVSHGCVRMRNEDVTKMFEKVNLGTKVIVVP